MPLDSMSRTPTHDLARGQSTPYSATGGSLRVVQERLRHADIQMTRVYTRLTQSELQQAVSVFDETGHRYGRTDVKCFLARRGTRRADWRK